MQDLFLGSKFFSKPLDFFILLKVRREGDTRSWAQSIELFCSFLAVFGGPGRDINLDFGSP
jgi:hypothetical protein